MTKKQVTDEQYGELRKSPMMAHLLDALAEGADIGHYGRLTFVMVARHFLQDEELVQLLLKQPDLDEKAARMLVLQVQERDYNPPQRNKILEWQSQQDFPICPTPDDPNGCNVYRELQFPDQVYQHVEEFYEERAEAQMKGAE
jgi:hypothetical protein